MKCACACVCVCVCCLSVNNFSFVEQMLGQPVGSLFAVSVPAFAMYAFARLCELVYVVLAALPRGPWSNWEGDLALTRAEVCKVRWRDRGIAGHCVPVCTWGLGSHPSASVWCGCTCVYGCACMTAHVWMHLYGCTCVTAPV